MSPRGEEATGGVEEADAGESIVGARVGIFWADDEIFYKVGFDTTSCYFRMQLHALSIPGTVSLTMLVCICAGGSVAARFQHLAVQVNLSASKPNAAGHNYERLNCTKVAL